MSKEQQYPIDLDRAADNIKSLESVMDSMRFTAPEVMWERKVRAAQILNMLAESLGLVGKASPEV